MYALAISDNAHTALTTAFAATVEARDIADDLRGITPRPGDALLLDKAVGLTLVAEQQALRAVEFLGKPHPSAGHAIAAIDAIGGANQILVDEPGTPNERADLAIDLLDEAVAYLSESLEIVED